MRQEESMRDEDIHHLDGRKVRIVRHRKRPSAVWLTLLLGLLTLVASLSFLLWGLTHEHQQIELAKKNVTEVAYVVLAFIPAALSVLFGIVAFKRINPHPRRYKGIQLTVLGMLMGASYLVTVIWYLWTNY